MFQHRRFSFPRRLVVLCVLAVASLAPQRATAEELFPPELVEFTAYAQNPVFTAAGSSDWDAKIRERGWIMRDDGMYHLWYTGYDGTKTGTRLLGYATSPDGIRWTRYAGNPLDRTHWIEDMMVVKDRDTYYMVAEGLNDIAQMLTSTDRVQWTRQGPLDVRLTNGKPIEAGPYGTPVLWKEGEKWYLFYERRDAGVWLATSTDRRVWTNVSDEPVLACGPDAYDRYMIAMNQVIKHNGRYYALYHALDAAKRPWTTNLATSTDLVHWQKYSKNPLVENNESSAIYVHDGERYRLYTMHDQVRLYLSKQATAE
jgi:sucrose-6-phosphate hydrolase SacC (GH32 family)